VGVHLIAVHLIAVHLTGMHLTGVYLTDVYLMSVIDPWGAMYSRTHEKAAENGASGGCFQRPFRRALTRGPCRFKLILWSYAKAFYTFKFSTRRLFSDISFPLPPFSHKRPILAPRPLTPKWTSLDLLRVMDRGIL